MGKEPYQSSELENNRQLVRNFVQGVLTGHDIGAANKYSVQKLIKHKEQVLQTYMSVVGANIYNWFGSFYETK
jgi:predicted SnoaL-like aldol condensation-catalyzing enzyme